MLHRAAVKHRHLHPANWVAAASGVCRCCLQTFWARQRLMRHLTVDSAACCDALLEHARRMSEDD
eukprot:917488-Alexandrium_andersonii.AAC.1